MTRTLRTAAGLGLICMVLAGAQIVRGQTVVPVPKLDLSRFTGTWHEAARYANKREQDCAGNVFMLIALGDKPNQLQMVNSCKTKREYTDVRNANIKEQDKSGDGKLKVRYLWPFSSKYWVLELGPDYEWVLIGNPNHKEMWVFSRTATLSPAVLATIEQKAAAEGFASAKLLMTR